MTKRILSLPLLLLPLSACGGEPALPDLTVAASAETGVVAGRGDAADDPAMWVSEDPGQSLVLGTDKQSGLYAYNLDGSIHQYLPVGRVNNVDVRYDFALPGPRRDIALASDRTNIAIAVFMIDPDQRSIEAWAPIPVDMTDPYGFCLYQRPDGGLYAFMTDRDLGTMVQYLVRYDGEGRLSADEVRRFDVGSVAEGCVVDDLNRDLYVAEEAVGIWRYSADPQNGAARELFAPAEMPAITPDVEGLAIWRREEGDRLIASSQGDSTYAVFDIGSGNFLGRFAVSGGDIDRTTETDGIEVFSGDLGTDFPAGIFIAQDDSEDSGGQNFKLVDLRDLEAVFSLP